MYYYYFHINLFVHNSSSAYKLKTDYSTLQNKMSLNQREKASTSSLDNRIHFFNLAISIQTNVSVTYRRKEKHYKTTTLYMYNMPNAINAAISWRLLIQEQIKLQNRMSRLKAI